MPWDDSGSPSWGEQAPSQSFPAPTRQGDAAGDFGAASADTSAWTRSGEPSMPWHAQPQPSGSAEPGYQNSATSDWTGTRTTSDWPSPDQDSPPAATLASTGRTAPPVHLLIAGLAAVAVAAGLWFVGGWQVNLLGWAIAAVLGLGSAFAFLSSDVGAQRNPWYIGKPSVVRPLQAAVIVGAIVVAAAHAWSFADWISRQDLLS